MKIQVVGTGNSWTFERLNTSFIIDDRILIDIPEGSYKSICSSTDVSKIEAIIITHFHSDHFVDIHLVLFKILKMTSGNKIKVFAPKGMKQKLIALLALVETPKTGEEIDAVFEFIDLKDSAIYQAAGYQFKAFLMNHVNLDAFGFLFDDNAGKQVAFTGDTGICDKLELLIAQADLVFMDCSNIEQISDNHLSLSYRSEKLTKYPNKRIIPIHVSDGTYKEAVRQKIEICDGTIIYTERL